MATAAAAAATIGISVELVVTASKALGVGVVGAIFTGKLIEQVRDWIKSRGVSSEISDHVMKKKHKFNDKCGADCILKVAYDIKSGSSWLADNGIPIIRGTGYCRHGCEIEVRLSIPLGHDQWKIGTAFHTGDCKAK